jgi:hypothetical protein
LNHRKKFDSEFATGSSAVRSRPDGQQRNILYSICRIDRDRQDGHRESLFTPRYQSSHQPPYRPPGIYRFIDCIACASSRDPAVIFTGAHETGLSLAERIATVGDIWVVAPPWIRPQ